MGMDGVLLGSMISPLLIAWGWRPIYLFVWGFKLPLHSYWLPFCKNLFSLIMSWVIMSSISSSYLTFINPLDGFVAWAIYAGVLTALFALCYFLILFLSTQGMRDVSYRMINAFKTKQGRGL